MVRRDRRLRVWLVSFDQDDCIGRHRFFSTDGAHVFAGFGFHIDRVNRQTEQFGQLLADFFLMSRELRFLSKDRAVEVNRLPTFFANALQRIGHENRGIGTSVRGIGIRKRIANISQSNRSQQSIRDGVQQDVGIAVA